MKTITDIRAEIDDAIGARADAETALTRLRNQKVGRGGDGITNANIVSTYETSWY